MFRIVSITSECLFPVSSAISRLVSHTATGGIFRWLMLREVFPQCWAETPYSSQKGLRLRGGVLFHPFFVEWWCRVVQWYKNWLFVVYENGWEVVFRGYGVRTTYTPCTILCRPPKSTLVSSANHYVVGFFWGGMSKIGHTPYNQSIGY